VERKKLLYLAIIYFFSGLPFGFFYSFIPVFLRTKGVALTTIGFFSLAGLPWSLRLLFAPFIDRYLWKPAWMGLSLLTLALTLVGIAFFPPKCVLFFLLLTMVSFCSTIFDTSADGFVVEWIPPKDLGNANGVRISAYRVALIFCGGGAIALSGYIGFKPIFFILASGCVLTGVWLLTSRFLKVKPQRKEITIYQQFIQPFKEILSRPKVYWLLLFVFTYKIGDALLGAMVYPFWVDRGFSRVEIGLISGVIGSILTIGGSLLGGWLSSRWSLKKSLFVLGLFQSFSNLGYALASLPNMTKYAVYAASMFESFTGGLGTAAFLTFLTALCKKEFSSTQYAVFSTLFTLSLTISRSLAGVGATYLGYTKFFVLTFFVSLPAFLLIPVVTQSRPLESGVNKDFSE